MSAQSVPFLNKSHNFGIFLKKGKRGILQLDFPSQMILMIQRGHIKKTQAFHSLLYFESEEDLHISLRFLDGELDFEADTAEEKYTICRLLDLILEAENSEPIRVLAAAAESGGVVPRVPLVPQNVLKDGVLEKKGNTTITTWNRRRVKISAGEFAYFKPGEELALNVVHLRQDRCTIQRVGQNSLHLNVNQRLYCFRVPNDSRTGLSVETARDDWIKAFEQAMTMKRAVSMFSPNSLLPPEEEDPGHQGDTETNSDVSSVDGSPFNCRKAPLESFGQGLEAGKPEITASVSVHFSYNNNNSSSSNNNNHTISSFDPNNATTTTTFVNPQAPRPAKRATVYPFRRQKDRGSDRHVGSSSDALVSRPHPDSLSDDLPVTALRAKFTGHSAADTDPFLVRANDLGSTRSASLKESKTKKLNDRVLAFSDLSLGEDDPKILVKRDLAEQALPKILDRRDKPEQALPKLLAQRDVPQEEAAPQTAGTDSPGEVLLQSKKYAKERPSVLEFWKELDTGSKASGADGQSAADRWQNTGGRTFRDDMVIDSRREPGLLELKGGTGGSPSGAGDQCGKGGKKPLWKASSMSDLLEGKDEEEKNKLAVAVKGGVPPPPPPPCIPPAPLLAPPVPAVRNLGGKGGVKLKQVHWTVVDKKLISVSLWSQGKTLLPTFDLKLLEAMFSISEREGTAINKNRAVKTSLVDARRAQNLGILFSGVKDSSVTQVLDALSSVTELDHFQLQKMASLKRFQPTAEDMEMFRMYRQSRDSLVPVDRFMLDLCQIPKLSMRIDLVLALWDFPNNYQALAEEVDELLAACELLLSNTSLPVVLRCLLSIGNHLNAKRQSKQAAGFQVSSVDKMVDLKGREPDYSLMTYLVEQLQLTRPDLLDWTLSLDLLPKVAGYSVRAIGAEIDVLKNDLQKVKKYQKAIKGLSDVHKKFQTDVQNFVLEHEKRMQTIHDNNSRLKHRFQQLLAWLGEPPTRTSDVLFSSLGLLIDRFNTARARLAT